METKLTTKQRMDALPMVAVGMLSKNQLDELLAQFNDPRLVQEKGEEDGDLIIRTDKGRKLASICKMGDNAWFVTALEGLVQAERTPVSA